MNDIPNRILIVGLGLMGGSIADALSSKGYRVEALDRNPDEIDYAMKQGWIVHGETEVREEYISSFSFIVFALYPSILVSWMKEHIGKIAPGTLLADICGIKQPIIQEILPLLEGRDVDFVFTHPMAGKARKGARYASKDIFPGSNFLITPTIKNKESSIRLLETFANQIGSSQIAIVTPKEHDEMIAYVSQLTHIIAMALMNAKAESHLDEFTGDSFRDLTRIAEMNDEMWPELFLMNQETLLEQMDLFLHEMECVKKAIANGSIDELRTMMKQTTKRRESFPSERKAK